MKKTLIALFLAASSLAASAYTNAWSSTLGNLRYTVSFPTHPFASCNTLLLDVTGDFENSSKWSAYGALNCKNGAGYGVNGTAYLGTNNHIYLWVTVGLAGHALCDMVNGKGSCTLYDTTTGKTYTGTIK